MPAAPHDPDADSQQPSLDTVALLQWLTANDVATDQLLIDPVSQGLWRLTPTPQPGWARDTASQRLLLTSARVLLQSADCPWPLTARPVDASDEPADRGTGRTPASLLLTEVSEQQAAAFRNQVGSAKVRHRQEQAEHLAQQRSAASDNRAVLQAQAAQWKAEHPRRFAPKPSGPLRRIPAEKLPVIGYSHGPEHYHGWTEPESFRPVGPDPVVRGARPHRGSGLWTSPATEQDRHGRVVATTWSTWWQADGGNVEDYSEHLRIEPNPGARIVLVDGPPDLAALVAAYPNPPCEVAFDHSHLYPDWYAVARDWDAVYLTADAAEQLCGQPELDADVQNLHGWLGGPAVLWLKAAYTVADGLGL